jgi:hypothetical protein
MKYDLRSDWRVTNMQSALYIRALVVKRGRWQVEQVGPDSYAVSLPGKDGTGREMYFTNAEGADVIFDNPPQDEEGRLFYTALTNPGKLAKIDQGRYLLYYVDELFSIHQQSDGWVITHLSTQKTQPPLPTLRDARHKVRSWEVFNEHQN